MIEAVSLITPVERSPEIDKRYCTLVSLFHQDTSGESTSDYKRIVLDLMFAVMMYKAVRFISEMLCSGKTSITSTMRSLKTEQYCLCNTFAVALTSCWRRKFPCWSTDDVFYNCSHFLVVER